MAAYPGPEEKYGSDFCAFLQLRFQHAIIIKYQSSNRC